MEHKKANLLGGAVERAAGRRSPAGRGLMDFNIGFHLALKQLPYECMD